MSANKKSNLWSRIISLGTATAILATSYFPWFETGVGQNVETLIFVWTWILISVGFIAVVMLGVGVGGMLYFSDNLTWEGDRETFTKASENLTEVKPNIWISIPSTLYWLVALSLADWTGTLVTYFIWSVLSYIVTYGLLRGLRNTMEKLKSEWEEESNPVKRYLK
ncbi:MAG: hypothetical protein ACXADH_05680 [Candidatus Kariarchaeaceae archaeon]|jgi:hypothetical protein